jgi:transcriptional regulator with XRE-family HTH domain
MSDEVPLSYARAVGDRLRSLRKQRGLSLLGVEAATGREFKASVLGAYERGERVISVLRLQRLAAFYRVPVDQVLPRHAPPAGDGRPAPEEFMPKRPLAIDMARLAELDLPEAHVVRRYLTGLQNERAGVTGRSMAIRVEDLRVLALLLERDPLSMEVRLVELGLRY